MKIVVDTNVVISGVFFGGFPQRILTAIVNNQVTAYATPEIIDEYQEIIEEMVTRKQGHIHGEILAPLIRGMEIIEPITRVEVCRDPDDDKFLGCAKDSRALYVVSGDKDLLDIGQYEDIQIITARDFCEKYLA